MPSPNTDAPRLALDATTVTRLQERYTAEPTRFCPDCGVEMRPCGPSVMCPVHRWRWSWFGPGDPDVLALLTAYDAAAAERAVLAEEAARYRAALGEIERVAAASILLSSQTAPVLSGGLARIVIRSRAVLAPAAGEGAGDGD